MFRTAYCLVCWLTMFAQLQDPTPTPGELGQNPQNSGAEIEGDATESDDPSPSAPALDNADSDIGEKPNRDEGRPKQSVAPTNGWSVANAVLTLFFTGVLASVAVLQIILMLKQSKLMHGELVATQVSADAAKKSADTAEQAVEQMRLEQRAWLSARYILGELKPGEIPSLALEITNSGRTPGTIDFVSTTTIAEPLPINMEQIFIMHAVQAEVVPRQNIVAPGSRFTVNLNILGFEESKTTEILAGISSVAAFATIWYRDISGRVRETKCCFVLNSRSRQMYVHERYNEMT